MKKIVLTSLAAAVLLAVPLLFLFVKVSTEDSWICNDGEWIKHGSPRAVKPIEPCPVDPHTLSEVEQIVRDFYEWYIKEASPLSTGKYKNRHELSESFKLKIAQIVQSNSMVSYDPILLTTDQPTDIGVLVANRSGDQARVLVQLSLGEISQMISVALQRQEGQWKITDVEEVSGLDPTERKFKTVIYFANPARSMGSTECGVVFGVERIVDNKADYEGMLNHLFAGPTTREQEDGFASLFSTKTVGILKSLKIDGSTAYINLNDIRSVIPSANSSCGSQEFFAQVENTLKHTGVIKRVFYAIDESPEDFYEWMQLGCSSENNFCDASGF